MAPAKKLKSVNKRFVAVNDSPSKNDASVSRKSKQKKRKLTGMLGPEWSKQELTRFYDAYRKCGKDWKKIAHMLRSRSVEMVEALYNMNREGGGSDTDSDNSDMIPQKHQKYQKGKVQAAVSKEDVLQPPVPSSDGGRCMSLLKMHLNGIQPFIPVRKRTPRIPVSSLDDEYFLYNLPTNKGVKKLEDLDDDGFAHGAARLSTDGRQKPEKMQPKHDRYGIDKEVAAYGVKINGAMYGGLARDADSWKETGSLTFVENKGNKGEKQEGVGDGTEQFDDIVEDCNSADKACGVGLFRKKRGYEAKNARTVDFPPQAAGKRNKKLLFEDDAPNFDALQTLVDLSLMMPTSAAETVESSRESVIGMDIKVNSTAHSDATLRSESAVREYKRKRKSLAPKVKSIGEEGAVRDTIVDSPAHSDTSLRDGNPRRKYKRKYKSEAQKKHKTEEQVNPHLENLVEIEVSADKETQSINGIRQDSTRIPSLSEHCQLARAQDVSSCNGQRLMDADIAVSSAQVSSTSEVLPSRKGKSRRKAERALVHKCPQNGLRDLSRRGSSLPHGKALALQDKLSNYLSCHMVRRWCAFEWFYSAIDYPWFAQMEFVEYLNHVGLGHIPRLTHVEWGVIRSSLGRPRRFSERFLLEERDKLEQYRESVRRHYAELRAGSREGLPSDLARPLSVGQRVIAVHPKTREFHDGSILTIEYDKFRVQFDHSDLGVELVKDIDCMPFNPAENMPEGLRIRRLSYGFGILKEPQVSSGGFMFPLIEHLEGVDVCNGAPPPTQLIKNQPKVLSSQVNVEKQSGYPGKLPNWPQHVTYSVGPSSPCPSTSYLLSSEEPNSNLVEIVKASREKAHGLVDTAIKALSSMKEGENAFSKIQKALSVTDTCEPASSSGEAPTESPIQMASAILEQQLSDDNFVAKSLESYDGKDQKIPSELITSCLVTYLMIQKCTERHHPPAEVAQLLDTAVKSLHPCCPQNLSIYRDIEICMGQIKTRILALVPT
ncbi:hypothetical protein Dimus_012193 [Dionaea muscipula]